MEAVLEVSTPEKVEEIISDIVITRSLTKDGVFPKKGNVFFIFSFLVTSGQDVAKHSGAIQITLDWESVNDVDAYIRKTYIYKGKPIPASIQTPVKKISKAKQFIGS